MKKHADEREIIMEAIDIAAQNNPNATDGKWLENLIEFSAPFIKEWDIAECHTWPEWPDREKYFPETTKVDIGIDLVAIRRSDQQHIAIQSKSRQLNNNNNGDPINKDEVAKFAAPTENPFWAERWVVTNGNCPLGDKVKQLESMATKPIKLVNIVEDLRQQQSPVFDDYCPHCTPPPSESDEPQRQTLSCMQNETVNEAVRILKEHLESESGGLPVGQARGRIILPCGTGKTRISLRIIEKLTPRGGLSIVLCPSIALVAQIRSEFLRNSESEIRALAVCSDQTAGFDPKKESSKDIAKDPTLDNSNVSVSDVKGMVSTDPQEIAEWIRQKDDDARMSVIFGTYQSGRAIADAISECGTSIDVLVADEAHRTAGMRKKRKAKTSTLTDEERRLRDFTLCHSQEAFPAVYRIYQTATPRIYDVSNVRSSNTTDWMVRTMDDESVFGVELYRRSYVEAVENGWLSDYRIIALGTNDAATYEAANNLAKNTKSKGRRQLTSADYLRGLAFTLAMGGATQSQTKDSIPIRSCIAFMNTVDKSKNMAEDLQTEAVREWLQNWLNNNKEGQQASKYRLEHLDAKSNVIARGNAIRRLADADQETPFGIINVGIFGEGTDSPSLNSVAFLESRRSPVDVIQAVGRAMRTAPEKQMGYIICPILIPPTANPEDWLSSSAPEEGWQELGQILKALRAHDSRIEDNLADLMHLYLPPAPEQIRTIVAIADHRKKRIQYRMHDGPQGEVQNALERVLKGESSLSDEEFRPVTDNEDLISSLPESHTVVLEPTQVFAGKTIEDGSVEVRMDTVARDKPSVGEARGSVNLEKTKKIAKKMINEGTGIRCQPGKKKPHKGKRTHDEVVEESAQQMLKLTQLDKFGTSIRMNLLSKSGLIHNRIVRDLNVLESGIKEAAFHLHSDELGPALDENFGLTHLKADAKKKQADGATIAALLMMNAAMLHQRIAKGGWLSAISNLASVKNDVNVVRRLRREWQNIMLHDFRPVIEPAVRVVELIEDTGKLSGLERALRHIAAEAERIAETYADMGADHAGPLFNRVMGNQASDGAYFTRPVAASIAARFTLDELADADWTDLDFLRKNKIADIACGSGTLLASVLAEMKRRARESGFDDERAAELQRVAVEDCIKGFDINPVSLQLAASQLTAGNQDTRYRRMGLHLMPYGPSSADSSQVAAGTLDLLGQRAILPMIDEFDLPDQRIASKQVWVHQENVELEDAVDAVRDIRIAIMNPPFTNRSNMGGKFSNDVQKRLHKRCDGMEKMLVSYDSKLERFVDKNSIRPLFVALADRCLDKEHGILTTVIPTIALTAPSGIHERIVLAQRYQICSVITCHQPGQVNMSQGTGINESIIVTKRKTSRTQPTKFINLDRFPTDESEVQELYECVRRSDTGAIPNGWGEVSEWPTQLIEDGDWSAAIWRSTELAAAAARLANDDSLHTIEDLALSPAATGQVLRGSYKPSEFGIPGSFPILKSKGSEAQTTIRSQPDEYWIAKHKSSERGMNLRSTPLENNRIREKEGYLLITAGQDTASGRLAATADDKPYVGNSWIPVSGLKPNQAKLLAVFINSTAGRLQLMRSPSKKLNFPTYSVSQVKKIRVPDIRDQHVQQTLAKCWEDTKDVLVPQYRDGECEVRRIWDEAVAEALNWDAYELERLRGLLHIEPHVSGYGYGQYADKSE